MRGARPLARTTGILPDPFSVQAARGAFVFGDQLVDEYKIRRYLSLPVR
jgi:hypothetical protein